MPRGNEIPVRVRSEIVALHNAGKGYKLISKTLQIPHSTVRNIVIKWKRFNTVATLSRKRKYEERTKWEIQDEVSRRSRTENWIFLFTLTAKQRGITETY